ncbi:arginase [Flavobacteriales bacterium 34_180_T64]|nr:arginase [Flavobacteriales bacterium 34_180_T64]
MDKLVLFNNKDLKNLLKRRSGESKFGKHIQLLPSFTNIYEDLVDLDVDYVIFGIKEDIGVFANYGKPGTSMAWDATLKVLLNIESSNFTTPKRVLILGHLDFTKSLEKLKSLDQRLRKDIVKARKKVAKIDPHVSHLVHQIVRAGKIPIIVGGGQNNAYGNIKGASLALKKPINAINFDVQSDFRSEEGRHSGNGFSYAYAEGFLKNYFIFGLHESYTSETIFKTIKKLKSIKYNTFEALTIRHELNYDDELVRALNHVKNAPFGIEIDCGAIENIPGTSITPNGFSLSTTSAFVNYMSKHDNHIYLHICEAVPTLETETQVGKLISHLIIDFMKP